jgi:hypothetical protein
MWLLTLSRPNVKVEEVTRVGATGVDWRREIWLLING